jgi:hypothetical protein
VIVDEQQFDQWVRLVVFAGSWLGDPITPEDAYAIVTDWLPEETELQEEFGDPPTVDGNRRQRRSKK